jgi:hypothetical protein
MRSLLTFCCFGRTRRDLRKATGLQAGMAQKRNDNCMIALDVKLVVLQPFFLLIHRHMDMAIL